jgi:hypothetical protein
MKKHIINTILVLFSLGCGAVAPGPEDTSRPDSGASDSQGDAGQDSVTPDSGNLESGVPDSGNLESGVPDSGSPDSGTPDTTPADTGAADVEVPDSGPRCPGGSFYCPGQGQGGRDCVALIVNMDNNNCGSCGHTCGDLGFCTRGVCGCRVTIPGRIELCSNTCTDLLSSNFHCGRCGNACSEGTECRGGSCR